MMGNIFKNIYTVITFITIGIGLIVAIIFLLGIIIGGQFGTTLAVAAGEIITWAIILAALAVLAGIIYIYIDKQHSLTIDSDEK